MKKKFPRLLAYTLAPKFSFLGFNAASFYVHPRDPVSSQSAVVVSLDVKITQVVLMHF